MDHYLPNYSSIKYIYIYIYTYIYILYIYVAIRMSTKISVLLIVGLKLVACAALQL